MNFINNLLAVPFGYMLSLFYRLTNNYLLAILFITLILRVILVPTSIKQQKNSAKQMRLQAKVNKIRQKYAGSNTRDTQMKISQETQELYKREGFNAGTAGCLPMFVQLFIMMGLYSAIYSPLSHVLRLKSAVTANLMSAYQTALGSAGKTVGSELSILAKFQEILPHTDPNIVTDDIIGNVQLFIDKFKIFGINLTNSPSQFREPGCAILIMIPVLAGITALLTSIFLYFKQRKENPEMAKNPAMGCMTFMSPVMSIVFAYTLPAGIGFYWIISNILSFIQTVALSLALKPQSIIAEQMIDETVHRRSRERSVKLRAEMAENQTRK